jgi:hypothetical protein
MEEVEFRPAAAVAGLRPPANYKISYTTTAAVMVASPRFPGASLLRFVCPVPGHERLNLSEAKRCGCREETFVPRYAYYAIFYRLLLSSSNLDPANDFVDSYNVKVTLYACDIAGKLGPQGWCIGLEPDVLEDIYGMTAAECYASPNPRLAGQLFDRFLQHQVVRVYGYVLTTPDGKYSNHVCVALRPLGITAQVPAVRQGPPPSARRSQPAVYAHAPASPALAPPGAPSSTA